jgi:hypothetical protein
VRWRVWLLIGFLTGLLIALLWAAPAWAETLGDRLAAYPDWHSKPSTQPSKGDLAYPKWMEGQWLLRTTQVDQVAPLAPEIVTPGFESNRQFLDRDIDFAIRFVVRKGIVVSDRAFNGLSIAKAYLGDQALAVKVDPQNPNRQLTLLKGDRQLESTISDRAVEQPDGEHFLTSEVFQQVFRTPTGSPYLNQVETTTAYRHQTDSPEIVADQVTAIYLSPSDPKYFQAGDVPVAIYRYRLAFLPQPQADQDEQ